MDEKRDYEVSSDPPMYAGEGEAVDMRGRHGRGSIVKNEAAELYGDIQTAEGEFWKFETVVLVSSL